MEKKKPYPTSVYYEYEDRIFKTVEDLEKYRESRLIEGLENLTYDATNDCCYARDVILLLLEHNICSKKKLKDLLNKVI